MKEKLGKKPERRGNERGAFEKETAVSCCREGKKGVEKYQWDIIIMVVIIDLVKGCFTGYRNLGGGGTFFHSERCKNIIVRAYLV